MVDIFDEVSEDLRHERAMAIARRWGLLFAAAAVLVVLGVAAQQGWQDYAQRQANKAAAQYLALTTAVDQQDTPVAAADAISTAQKLVSFAASAPETYKTLARLRAAGLFAQAQQLPQAAALWTEVSADEAADSLLRDAATVLWAEHEVGTAPDAQVLARVQPLVQAQNPYHGLAREAQALAYLHQGNQAMAKSLFSQIANDPGAPQGVRNRAQAMLAGLNG